MPTSLLRRPARQIAGLCLVGGLAAAGLSACGADDSGSDSESSGSGTSGNSGASGVSRVAVSMEDSSCNLSAKTAKAGPVTFSVENKSATGLTEVELIQDQRILGEKENLAPGLGKVEFTVTLGGGDYQIYCPGAEPETTDLKVTGKAAEQTGSTQALLQQGSKDYGNYVDTQVSAMETSVKDLQAKIDAGDLAGAQKAYGQTRPYYERIESDVDGFLKPGAKVDDNAGNLDYLVDMRASNLDPAVGWSGFHAVERDLFGRQKITAETKKYAADLTANITELATVAKSLEYKPEDLANGAAGLLEEVQSNKITGEEEAFSHIDLVDFAGNVEGAKEAFAYLKPGLNKIDPTLTKQIAANFEGVETMLDTYRDDSAVGGYKSYTAELKKTDANKLSQTVQALQDSLSRLAEKVATA